MAGSGMIVTAPPTVGGIGWREIAERFGTPCYVYDAARIERTHAELTAALHPALGLVYSVKANPNVAVCATLARLGTRAEVSSPAELEIALAAGFRPADLMLVGPGKSRAEIRRGLEVGVRAVVCESFGELDVVEDVAAALGRTAPVLLRINPAFTARSTTLVMGGKPRQFGIDEEQVLDPSSPVAGRPHVRIAGVHVYMGTRLLDHTVVVENTTRILDLADRVAAAHGLDLELVDVGGGLGVPYFPGEQALDREALAAGMNPLVERFRATHPDTALVMELGRYLVAAAGTYLVGIRYTKTSMGENFAIADGGTNHHMAAVGVGSFVKRDFPAALLDVSGPTARPRPWTVTGPLCTPADTLLTRAELPGLVPGDLVGVLCSGAYGPSASPGLFLGHGFPAEVLVADGVAYLVREPDTPADLLAKQRLPHCGAGRRAA